MQCKFQRKLGEAIDRENKKIGLGINTCVAWNQHQVGKPRNQYLAIGKFQHRIIFVNHICPLHLLEPFFRKSSVKHQ